MAFHPTLTPIALLILMAMSSAPLVAAERVVQYRGDRNGHFIDAKPPVTFDGGSGKNIRWKTELPNWCYGNPLVVGQKVFVMSESGWKSDWPELVCLDLKSGKILWQQPINHLEVAIPDAGKRKRYEVAWANHQERFRRAFALNRRINEARAKGDTTQLIKLVEEADAEGWVNKRWKRRNPDKKETWRMQSRGSDKDNSIFGVPVGVDPKLGVTQKEMKKSYDLRHETFWGAQTERMGEAFPSPVSDGEHVYVVTGHGSYASFDLNGKIRWHRWIRSGLAKHDDSIGRTPLLSDGLLICDTMAEGHPKPAMRAFDSATGKLVWESLLAEGGGRNNGVGSSKLIELGGANYVVMASGHLFRVSDGKQWVAPFGKAYNMSPSQTEIGVVDDRDLVIVTKGRGQGSSGLFAIKLSIDGDTVREEVVWEVPCKKVPYTHAITEDAIYIGSGKIDIANGTLSAWGGPGTRWLLAAADGKVFGLVEVGKWGRKAGTEGSARMTVVDAKSGKHIGSSLLPGPAFNDLPAALKDRRLATTGGYGCRFSYSAPFILVDDMILVRSHDHLWCIGK